MGVHVLPPDVFREHMIARVTPTRWHDQVKEFILYPRGPGDIFRQVVKFAKVYIEKISGIDTPGNAILDRDVVLFGLIGLEDPVPDVQQVAEVGVHVERVSCMVNTVVGGGEDEFAQETKAGIFHEVLTHMNKSTPRAVNEHDGKQHDRRDARQDANGGPDKVGVGPLQEKVGIRNRQVHLLRSVVRRMQTPEQSHLMGKKVIDEVCKLPDNVTIDEPVPRKGNRQQRVGRQQTDTKRDDAKRDKLSDNAIEYVNKERDLILRPVEILMGKGHQDLNDHDKRNERRKNGLNPVPGAQRTVVAGANDLDESVDREEAGDLVP